MRVYYIMNISDIWRLFKAVPLSKLVDTTLVSILFVKIDKDIINLVLPAIFASVILSGSLAKIKDIFAGVPLKTMFVRIDFRTRP